MPRRVDTVLKGLTEGYELLKKKASKDAKSSEVAALITKFTTDALTFLSSCRRVELTSRVADKKYFSFNIPRTDKLSRSVNQSLFSSDSAKYANHFLNGTLNQLTFAERYHLLYTLAISYCCAADLLKEGDQKTPATFFECLIAHLFARTLDVNPKTQVEVLKLEEEGGTLPTDLIFDLGKGKPKFHVPVKTSTRERVIQVFAHQRVLDGVHGFGSFRGILVCLAETKLDHRSREVVEICVPKQWTLYYKFIAPMLRFYYFDVPRKYETLASGDPPMAVMPFASFFDEVERLTAVR
ncbi:MAG: hypothetical protein ACRENG_09240, partial [bacterium]